MAKKKPKIGHRPSSYRAEYARIAFQHTLIGATDADLAAAFDVSEKTINTWKQKHPPFLQSLKAGKAHADSKVADCLFRRAIGYDHKAVKIFNNAGESFEHEYIEHIPPDTTAQIFWLKNRRPAQFRANPEVSVTVNNEVSVEQNEAKPAEKMTVAEMEAELVRLGVQPPTIKAGRNGHAAPK